MRVKEILIIAAAFLPLMLSALTLDEAIDSSIENNHSLQREKAEIEVYDQKYYAARGMLLPQLSLQGQYGISRTKIPDSSLGSVDELAGMLNNELGSMSESDEVLWENEQLISGYLDAVIDDLMPDEYLEEGSFAGGISLTQTVFAGGKLLSGINIADRVRNMQKDKYHLELQEVIYETMSLYYGVKLAEEVLQIQQEALSIAGEHLIDVQAMYEQGLVSEYDKLRAELEYNRLEPEVLRSQYNLNLARDSFCNYTGIDKSMLLELETEFVIPQTDSMQLNTALQFGMNKRIELQLADLNVRIQEVLVKMEKADFYPVVGLTASYNYYTAADEYEIEGDDFGTAASVGLGFQLPVFTGLTRISEVREKQATLKQAKETEIETISLIRLDIRNAWQNLDHSIKQLEVQNDNRELAERGYEIAQSRYANGQGTELEIADAQLLQKQAKLSYSNAVYELILAKTYFDKATGKDLNMSRKEN